MNETETQTTCNTTIFQSLIFNESNFFSNFIGFLHFLFWNACAIHLLLVRGSRDLEILEALDETAAVVRIS